MTLEIIGRREWGAKHRAGFGARRLPTSTAWLHHSVALHPDLVFTDLNRDGVDDDEAAAMRQVETIGQQRFGAGVSYNLAVAPSGRLYEGCGVDRVGAHTKGLNTTALGVVLLGNYSTRTPTQAQQDTLVTLLQEGYDLGWIDAPRFDGGHRDVPGASTACPGAKAHALIPTINARAAGPRVPANSATLPPALVKVLEDPMALPLVIHANGPGRMAAIIGAPGRPPFDYIATGADFDLLTRLHGPALEVNNHQWNQAAAYYGAPEDLRAPAQG